MAATVKVSRRFTRKAAGSSPSDPSSSLSSSTYQKMLALKEMISSSDPGASGSSLGVNEGKTVVLKAILGGQYDVQALSALSGLPIPEVLVILQEKKLGGESLAPSASPAPSGFGSLSSGGLSPSSSPSGIPLGDGTFIGSFALKDSMGASSSLGSSGSSSIPSVTSPPQLKGIFSGLGSLEAPKAYQFSSLGASSPYLGPSSPITSFGEVSSVVSPSVRSEVLDPLVIKLGVSSSISGVNLKGLTQGEKEVLSYIRENNNSIPGDLSGFEEYLSSSSKEFLSESIKFYKNSSFKGSFGSYIEFIIKDLSRRGLLR